MNVIYAGHCGPVGWHLYNLGRKMVPISTLPNFFVRSEAEKGMKIGPNSFSVGPYVESRRGNRLSQEMKEEDMNIRNIFFKRVAPSNNIVKY